MERTIAAAWNKDSVADPFNRENCKSMRLSTPSDKVLEPSMYMIYIDLESPMEPCNEQYRKTKIWKQI